MTSHLIDNQWRGGDGPELAAVDPTTGEPGWSGHAATEQEVAEAIPAARRAAPAWAGLPVAERIACVEAFAEELRTHRDELAVAISTETGKPRWEALTEVDAMIGKAPVSIDALHERRSPVTGEVGGARARTRFKPHGVLVVLGPFNFPGHLPNGHIVPALLAGNTVVFKPSDHTPGVGEQMVRRWLAAGLPPGVLNLVQGGRDTGEALARHPGHDGILFTGSHAVGRALSRTLADHPEKLLALEMGGNNPLVVHRAADLDAAAYHTILSAYLTAGQRCTCARRLIVPAGDEGDRFVDRLVAMIGGVRVGPWTAVPEPFMGPVISTRAAAGLLRAQHDLVEWGGQPLAVMQPAGGRETLLTPGLIDVTAIAGRPDEEVFGPLLQLIRVPDFDAAIDEASRTAFGLAAGLFSDDAELFDRFFRHVRAGVINWNRQTTGASGRLPFGGVGKSGNHRPSGYYAADYCAYPVASLEHDRLTPPDHPVPGLTP